MAVKRTKKDANREIMQGYIFLGTGLFILIVMCFLMFKDTHPDWLSYQRRFKVIERKMLEKKAADLLAQINHPNYLASYQKAHDTYLEKKGVYDTASSALEATEADLEELELRAQAGKDEEGGGEAAKPASGKAPATSTAVAPSKSELDDLDKEFADNKASKQKAAAPAKEAPAKPAAKTKPSAKAKSDEQELADLDKEFADSKPSKQPAKAKPKASKPGKQADKKVKSDDQELADLDKEFADSKPKASAAPDKTGAKSDELSDLDKEFASSDKAKPEDSHGSTSSAPAAPIQEQPTFEEADFKVDIPAAQARLEAAQRDLGLAERNHNREVLGLAEDATLRHQLSDARLKEAQQTLDVANSGLDLEKTKQVVKQAALVARWSIDAKTLSDLTQSNSLASQPEATQTKLADSKKNLDAFYADLTRELRLTQSQLKRNQTEKPAIEQIIVDRLGTVDRCVTCHKGVEEPGLDSAPEPFRTHNPDVLRFHPVDRFGCVSCHGGSGAALDKEEAHGALIGKGRPLARGRFVQLSCGKCHGDTRQLAGEDVYLAGAKLFANSGCSGCHKVDQLRASLSTQPIVGDTSLPKVGPALDRVGEKLNGAWLVGWLQNPQSHSLDARMPNMGLRTEDASAIATFLLTQRQTEGGTNEQPSKDPAWIGKGERLFSNLGCNGCHVVRGEGRAVGPDLTNINRKVSPTWLYGWIQNPKNYFSNSRMPVLNLTTEQSRQIGDYLLTIDDSKPNKWDTAPDLSDSKAAELGRTLVAQKGCAGCHDIKGFERISAPELSHIGDKTADVLEFGHVKGVERNLHAYIVEKILSPRSFDTDKFHGKMPTFGLSNDDAETLAVYLMSLTSQEIPPEYTRDVQEQSSALVLGRKIFENHDCGACHRLSGVGGKIGPELTREGEMVRPGWLFDFLKNPSRIRWWQDARMPDYKLTDKEATTLTEFFMALANQPAPYEYTPGDQRTYPLAQVGAKYFEELKCQSCHPLAGKQGVAGGDSKKLGPDLGLGPTRLKKDWIFRFLKDPQGFSPGTQMPTFNKPDEMYQAIVDYLMKPPPSGATSGSKP